MKAISTFIATVLLVIIAVAIGSFLIIYFRSFIAQKTKTAEQTVQTCNALMRVSTDLNSTHLKLFYGISSGSDKLNNLTLTLACSDKIIKENLDYEMKPGDFNVAFINVTDLGCSYENMKIIIGAYCNEILQTIFECEGKFCK